MCENHILIPAVSLHLQGLAQKKEHLFDKRLLRLTLSPLPDEQSSSAPAPLLSCSVRGAEQSSPATASLKPVCSQPFTSVQR
jgi:hypothetical protein